MSQPIPVLVGLSQILQRTNDPAEAKEPLELMIEAVRGAAEDAGAPALLDRASSIRVVKGVWGYKNPALAVAEVVGAPRGVETAVSVLGGNHVQMMVNLSALDIQSGGRDVVVLTGGECGRTLGKAPKAGVELDWLEARGGDPTPAPDVEYGNAKWTRHEAEMARGLQRAVQYYSLFENALRHAAGESIDEHLARISRLWAGFNTVAQGNPSAWIRNEVTAEEIRTVSPSNRPITFPYPKLMNANMRVDMGAALILCTLDTARSLGIAEAKMVFPLAGTDASDHYFVSERDNLHSSPAIRIAGARALELAGTQLDDLAHVDLYSCFPSAVQVSANELGLSHDRPLSVTGGLTFGGGPLNNYVMHSIARTAELLRNQRGERALVTANGGMLTKHSFGVYGTEPPAGGFSHENLQERVAREPKREAVAEHAGGAEIESYTVMFGSKIAKPTTSYTSIYGKSVDTGTEPTVAHLACRLSDGRRTWANLEDAEVLDAMCREEFCGRPVKIDGHGAAVMA
ncbi:MAG: acetyl-CoA acetyltransferase [Acidobacteriota bacterium]|nr:acetyl-CoA acetyltransferase [Acidobacteriota bacterium]